MVVRSELDGAAGGAGYVGVTTVRHPEDPRHATPPATLSIGRPRHQSLPRTAPPDRLRSDAVGLRPGVGSHLCPDHRRPAPRRPVRTVPQHGPATAPRVLPARLPESRTWPPPTRPGGLLPSSGPLDHGR